MQSAKYRLCDDLAAGLARPKMRHSRIVGRTLAKWSMRAPTTICHSGYRDRELKTVAAADPTRSIRRSAGLPTRPSDAA